ncbi:hypothetical protein AK88_05241 [Plasmodium fragile]|uniref:Uncharacterized protein n=1 Tax=Plasmodium fragile TaxID=5857 RepID=A0A0D9QHF6_PLAFR|nr:uncharacterized protein AK88_05241 [Plasmodium fragile]KJP85131.1 hypothetical protein AK88_05241 [Plasmodium fragile]
MNNGTRLQSEMFDGNDRNVTTVVSNSTPLATHIDPFSLEGATNQVSTVVTTTLVEGLVNGVTQAITDAVGTITSSISDSASSSLQPISAVNSDSVPIIHTGTNSSTAQIVPFRGKSEDLFLLLNIFIFLLPFISLLIVIPFAAFLYDHTPVGQFYNELCDFLCITPEDNEDVNEDEDEMYNDRLSFTYYGNGNGRTFFNPPCYGSNFKTFTQVEGEKDNNNGNDNKRTRTKGRKHKQNIGVEHLGHVNFTFCSASLESCTQENEVDHL